MTRRALLAGAAGVLAAGAARGSSSRRAGFDTTMLELRLPMDPAHDGVRIAQLSDVHVGLSTPRERIRAAVEAINASAVDLVVLTGDYVTNSEGPVPRVAEQLGGLTAPTFAVLGNHDHWVDAHGVTRQLERAGYEVLRNAHTRLQVRGVPLTIVGVDDGCSGHDDVGRALRGVGQAGTRVVLAHAPPTADRLPEGAGLLCLSGHTHGGQIAVPGLTERLMRRLGQPYVRGRYSVRGNTLYVNRGLGYGVGGPAVRLGSRPEVSFFTLRVARPGDGTPGAGTGR